VQNINLPVGTSEVTNFRRIEALVHFFLTIQANVGRVRQLSRQEKHRKGKGNNHNSTHEKPKPPSSDPEGTCVIDIDAGVKHQKHSKKQKRVRVSTGYR